MKKYDYIIVGDGVAARCVLSKLIEFSAQGSPSILQISDSVTFPACSERTTSMVPIDVFTKGLSPLGDLLYNAHEFFEETFSKQGHRGINPVAQYHMPPGRDIDPLKHMQFETRFGTNYIEFRGNRCVRKDAYQVNAQVLLRELASHYSDQVESITGIVTEADSGHVKVGATSYYGDKIVLCTSAYTKFFFQDEKLPQGKGVKGTFLDFQNVAELASESFVLSKGHFNFSYDHANKSVLFGANSIESFTHLNNISPTKDQFEIFKNYLGIELDYEDARCVTGVRHKGRRRMPFFSEVRPGVTVICSLYKNGWALAPYFANEYVKKVN